MGVDHEQVDCVGAHVEYTESHVRRQDLSFGSCRVARVAPGPGGPFCVRAMRACKGNAQGQSP